MLPGCERTSSSPMMERFLLLSSEMYSSNSWLISESQESHQRVLFWGTSWYIIGFLDTLPQPRHLINMKMFSTFSSEIAHKFQNAQVAVNKKCTQFLFFHTIFTLFSHYFLENVIALFCMVWFILFGVSTSKKWKYKLLIGCWRISTNENVFSRRYSWTKTDHTNWKEHQKISQELLSEAMLKLVFSHLCLWTNL